MRTECTFAIEKTQYGFTAVEYTPSGYRISHATFGTPSSAREYLRQWTNKSAPCCGCVCHVCTESHSVGFHSKECLENMGF
jgi:hypothetical protein